MYIESPRNNNKYYTRDHDWIDFQGAVAYIGICNFKLSKFKTIEEIIFSDTSGYKRQGEVIAIVRYNDCKVEAHMPVDGKIVEVNDALISGDNDILLRYAENDDWLALIIPSQRYERKDLLLPEKYHLDNKNKYKK